MNKPHIKPKVLHLNDSNYNEVAEEVHEEIQKWDICKLRRSKVSTCPVCFDTETTKINDMAFIYVYQLQVGRLCILCRIKSLIMSIFKEIHYTCDYLKCRCYCGIANIKYEWSFLCKDFMTLLSDVNGATTSIGVLLDKVDPLNVNLGRIVLVDICKMSGCSLAKIGKDYCTTQKLKGDLDYNKIRNSMTKLNEQELGYCINDVVVGAEYLIDRHERYTKKGKKIPLTSTGIVRDIMKAEAYRKEDDVPVYGEVLKKVKEGFPEKYTEYSVLVNQLFRGGYTHGNLYYVSDLLTNVEHVDYTSDYPACMLQYKYATKFTDKVLIYCDKKIYVDKLNNEDGINNLIKYEADLAFYATFKFHNLRATTDHSIESINKLLNDSNKVTNDNGRIRKSDIVEVMLTEQDYIIYTKFYKWDSVEIKNLRVGIKERLPWYVIKAVIESYVDKKRLKDLGLPYVVEKAILNSCYGCTVQGMIIGDCRDEYLDDDIKHIKSPIPFKYLDLNDDYNLKYFGYIKQKLIKKYKYIDNEALDNAIRRIYNDIYEGNDLPNNEKYMNIYQTTVEKLQQRSYKSEIVGQYGQSKFLSVFWGIWVTAYARRRLLSMVYELEMYAQNNDLGPIVVYCDTDSMFINCHQTDKCWKDVKAMIDQYNKDTEDYNIDNLRIYNEDGLLDDIGLFTWEPTCTHFKQLGAKRYLQRFKKGTEYVIESTVAGLSKSDFSNEINKIEGTIEDKFNYFSDGMVFEPFQTSKLMPVYITKPYSCEVTDDEGNTEMMHEKCGQILKPVGFNMMLFGLLAETVKKRVG